MKARVIVFYTSAHICGPQTCVPCPVFVPRNAYEACGNINGKYPIVFHSAFDFNRKLIIIELWHFFSMPHRQYFI